MVGNFPKYFPVRPGKKIKQQNPCVARVLLFVEPAGVEPASKHMPDKLSTCLFLDWISGASRARTNLLAPYLFWFSSRTHSGHKPIPLFVDSAAGTATGSLPGGYKGCLISD